MKTGIDYNNPYYSKQLKKLVDILEPYRDQIRKVEIEHWIDKKEEDDGFWEDEFDTLWITFADKSLLGLDYMYECGCDETGEGFMADQLEPKSKYRFAAPETAISYKIKQECDMAIELKEVLCQDFDAIKEWFYGEKK